MEEINDRASAIERLKLSYQTFYNVYPSEDEGSPLAARCDFFEHSEKYFLSRKAELWSADCEEFLYILNFERLTLPLYQEWRDYCRQDGMERLHVAPGHMYTYITPVFVCDSCDADARKALKHCHIFKSFHLSLYGWMDFHTALVEIPTRRIASNTAGRQTAKVLKKVLGF